MASWPWELLDCRYLIASVDVLAERLEARLPAGFALDADGSPLAPVSGDAPYLGVEMFACADGAGWFSTYTSVVPPPDLVVADHLLFVMWDTAYAEESARDALAGRGFPVRNGSVVITGASDPLWEGVAQVEGLGTVRIAGAFPRAGATFAGDFVEYMEAEDGTLSAWRTHYEAQTLTAGNVLVEAPTGSWLADVLGGTSAPANAITGTWSFTGGNIAVPAR